MLCCVVVRAERLVPSMQRYTLHGVCFISFGGVTIAGPGCRFQGAECHCSRVCHEHIGQGSRCVSIGSDGGELLAIRRPTICDGARRAYWQHQLQYQGAGCRRDEHRLCSVQDIRTSPLSSCWPGVAFSHVDSEVKHAAAWCVLGVGVCMAPSDCQR